MGLVMWLLCNMADMMVAGDQIGGSGASCSHLTGGSAGWSVCGEASGHQPSVEGLCSPVSSRVGNDGLSLSEGGRCDSVSPPRSHPQPEAMQLEIFPRKPRLCPSGRIRNTPRSGRKMIHGGEKDTRRRMARERRGAGSSLVSMETPYYKTIY